MSEDNFEESTLKEIVCSSTVGNSPSFAETILVNVSRWQGHPS